MRSVHLLTRRLRTALYLTRRVTRLNVDFYRRHYPDVRELNDDTVVAHWRSHGWREGRIPSWSALRRAFWRRGLRPRKVDYLAYLALNGDLVQSGYTTVSQSAAHYLQRGRKESRGFAFELPADFVALLNTNRIEELWPAVPTQAGHTPGWDARAMREFLSPLEQQLSVTSVDDFLVKTYSYFAGHTPRGIDLDRFGSTIEYGTPRAVPFAFIAADALIRWSAAARNMPVPPVGESRQRYDRATEVGLMGMPVMTTADWFERAVHSVEELGAAAFPSFTSLPASPKTMPSESRREGHPDRRNEFDVAVICSVYRPGRHLESFLHNIAEQTIFEQSEVVIVAVELTPVERDRVREFASAHPNVIVAEYAHRIGIYEAWNHGVRATSAPLVTNMNVDDLRRHDSLEIQRNTLQRFPWADVVVQDVQLMLSRDFSWPVIEQINAATRLPMTGVKTLASGLNPPHNAPMWRRRLHDTVGFFREDLRSVSDWDFWIRVAQSGGRFLGTSEAHVGYFINPDGLSTSADGVARHEHRELLSDYVHLLSVPGPTGNELTPDIRATPISRADRYSAGMISVFTAQRKEGKR